MLQVSGGGLPKSVQVACRACGVQDRDEYLLSADLFLCVMSNSGIEKGASERNESGRQCINITNMLQEKP